MKPLTAIFTFNRGLLLDNCLRSFEQFGPGGDLLIVDDGSNQPGQLEVLDHWEKRENVYVIRRDGRAEARLGGLYNNMQKALDWAREHGYELLFCNQDDLQFMWKDDDFWSNVETLFQQRPKALQYRPQFEKIIFQHDHKKRFTRLEDLPAWLHLKARYTAVGVFSIERMESVNWHFLPSERENGAQAAEYGLELYVASMPTLAFVPEPPTWHDANAAGEDHPPTKEFYLKPLSEQQIKRMQKNSMKTVAYMEKYCFPWGWKAESPYILSTSSANLRSHQEKLKRWIKKGYFLRWPRQVGVD